METNNLTNETRAIVINEALPYLREYSRKIIVVKYGGAAMTDKLLKDAVMSDIALLTLIGIKIVLVHGGGPEINSNLKKIGIEPKFINGLRYTDEATVDVVQSTLCGKVNKDLAALISRHGGKALGFCGADGGLMTAEKLKSDVDLGFVGEVAEVNKEPIEIALSNGYIPVIATVAPDKHGQMFNINADSAAARLAAEIGARNLILMTDTAGILRDKDDPSTLIKTIRLDEVPLLKESGIISGGMLPKIDCSVEAVRRGVHKANIIDGRIPHSVLLELLTNEGAGTMFEM